ncbi:MAG: YkgJ family cysteine cluster protein [Deltaproteobacteria bacterium]|nr:YkgJ family cysteine cluster protein [Deltaproteobacteria bacterium]
MGKKKQKRKDRIKKMLKVQCEGCGGCCIDTIVPVTDSDVKRLTKHTKMKADQIVRLYDSTDIAYESDWGAWIDFNYGKRLMGLKKRNGRCQFLDKNNRCTVYNARPATCRTFPLEFHMNEDGQIHDITLNKIIKKKYPFGASQDLKEATKKANMEDNEDERYYTRVDAWNNKTDRKGKTEYLKFMKLS